MIWQNFINTMGNDLQADWNCAIYLMLCNFIFRRMTHVWTFQVAQYSEDEGRG